MVKVVNSLYLVLATDKSLFQSLEVRVAVHLHILPAVQRKHRALDERQQLAGIHLEEMPEIGRVQLLLLLFQNQLKVGRDIVQFDVFPIACLLSRK